MHSLPFLPLSALECRFQNKTGTEPREYFVPVYFHSLSLSPPLSSFPLFIRSSGGPPRGTKTRTTTAAAAASQESLPRKTASPTPTMISSESARRPRIALRSEICFEMAELPRWEGQVFKGDFYPLCQGVTNLCSVLFGLLPDPLE